MEEHRPKKLLDQVRACPQLAEGMPSASNTVPIAPSRPTSAGSNATSTSTACATRPKWAIPRSKPFSPTWRSRKTSLLRHRTRPSAPSCSSTARSSTRISGRWTPLRAKRPRRLPTVLTKEETLRLIGCLSGTHQLMAKLIYGSGVRLMECLRLRVKDLQFERRALIVRDGKGPQDRVTVLPHGGSCDSDRPA